MFSVDKYIKIDNKDYSFTHIINKNNFKDVFDRAQINTKVILIGSQNEMILPYRELQSRNKKVYLIRI